MRLSRRQKYGVVLMTLFIIINVCLVYFANEERVDKVAHIQTWAQTTEQAMYESVMTEGVLDYATENEIYFSDELGEFDSFHVDKGEKVNTGDELYTYQISNYEETMVELEREIEKVDEKIKALDKAISKMENYQINAGSSAQFEPTPGEITGPYGDDAEHDFDEEFTAPFSDEVDDDTGDFLSSADELGDAPEDFEESINGVRDSNQAELLKEQYMSNKEVERAESIAKLDSLESQLAELTQMGDVITVKSPYTGIVSNRSETLDSPIMTIQSDDLIVKGELTEKDHLDVESGQSVYISMQESGEITEGEVEEVNQIPEAIELDEESNYAFNISLTEDTPQGASEDFDKGQYDDAADGKMTPGYHVDLEIVTEESPRATTIHQKGLKEQYIWKMSNGVVRKETAQTGIKMGSDVEIKEGAEPGEWIAFYPKKKFVSGAPYLTSLKFSKINWGGLVTDRWLRDLTIGLLSH